MKEYIKGIDLIAKYGFSQKPAREGMPSTKSYSNLQLRFPLSEGKVPILTTKEVSFKNVMVELLWFLKGEQNIKYLLDNNCNIWNDNAYGWFVKLNKEEDLGFYDYTKDEFVNEIKHKSLEDLKCFSVSRHNGEVYTLGDNGRIYGWQWRMRKVDQLQRNLDMLRDNPFSRHNKTNAWVTEDMNYDLCSQPNCHGDFMIQGREISFAKQLDMLKTKRHNEKLSFNPSSIREDLKSNNIPSTSFGLSLNQRSGDYALGIPYNITSYAMTSYIFGIISNTVPSSLNMNIVDAHSYIPHIKPLKEQGTRETLPLPTLLFKGKTLNEAILENKYKGSLDAFLDDVTVDDFKLVNYQNQGKVAYKLFTGKANNNNSQSSKK